MLDRLLKLVVTLTLALFLVQAVVDLLSRVVEHALAQAMGEVGRAGSLLFVLAGVAFFVGLLVRGVRFLGNRDPRAARERETRDRALRQRVRRPAEGVPPVESHAEVLDDPDPAIGEEVRG